MTILLQKQLDYVAQTRMQRFRPSKFRRILPVDNSVPTWADRVEHSEIRQHGSDPVRIAPHGPVKNLPRPTLSRTDAYINILRFGYSYGYSIFDLERAAQQDINLPATEAVTVQGIVERYLDEIAAGEHLATLGTPGLLNVASITPLTAITKAAGGTNWLNAGGGLNATFEEIFTDISRGLWAIQTNTLENYEGNLVILPLAEMQGLSDTWDHNSRMTVMNRIRNVFPGVRFETWNRLALADAAGTGPRMVCMAEGDEVARMILPQELKDEAPQQEPFAIVIPQWMSTAGVLVETPTAITYTDGI